MSYSYEAEFLSIYVPYVPKYWDEESIRRLFADSQIGFVERVDFFDAGNWEWALGAFVHLRAWEYSETADSVYETLNCGGEWKLQIPNQRGKFFILKKMTGDKIPETHLNVHQLAAKMTEMAQEIAELRSALGAALSSAFDASLQLQSDEMIQDFECDNDNGNLDFLDKYDDTQPLSMEEMASRSLAINSL
jgi:hypothetical protein